LSKRKALGYTEVLLRESCLLGEPGLRVRGHEFHYSKVVKSETREGMHFSFRMERGEGIIDKMDGLCYKNVLATYTHLHALGSPEWVSGLVKQAYSYKKKGCSDAEKRNHTLTGRKKI